MAIFITGVTGYIGGSVAARLIEAGKEVRGLVRSEEKADLLKAFGIVPVIGSLDDSEILNPDYNLFLKQTPLSVPA